MEARHYKNLLNKSNVFNSGCCSVLFCFFFFFHFWAPGLNWPENSGKFVVI